jgi:hypothetical protein
MTRLSDSELGKHGEEFTAQLLEAQGYGVEFLSRNSPTYDLKVSIGTESFLISVKVSRTKQHVRLGQRKSVLGLTNKNFVFAYAPRNVGEIQNLNLSPYQLLIIPGEVARIDSLQIHDAYWAERSKDPNIFSVIVKAYDRYGRPAWQNWQKYDSAFNLLPSPISASGA